VDLNGNAWAFERDAYGSLARLVEWQHDAQTERVIECGVGRGRSTVRRPALPPPCRFTACIPPSRYCAAPRRSSPLYRFPINKSRFKRDVEATTPLNQEKTESIKTHYPTRQNYQLPISTTKPILSSLELNQPIRSFRLRSRRK
ncbi:hypothetical protein G3N57_09165, partial [Paraburkholderia sp. Se-20369]|nr:hypothetical protein [Paraburkholderia sp. Se-20369]